MTPKEELLEEIKNDIEILLENPSLDKVEIYFKYSINFIKDYCNQDFTEEQDLDTFPTTLVGVITNLIIIRLNKQGGEGKDREKLGDYNVAYSEDDLTPSMRKQLNKYRVMRVI